MFILYDFTVLLVIPITAVTNMKLMLCQKFVWNILQLLNMSVKLGVIL